MSIEVRNVSKRFGDFQALDDVSLDVDGGSLTALLGPSGSGKSTLLRIVAGLETADTGGIRLAGEDATVLAPQQRGVGFVFQHYAAFKHLSVFRNVAFGLEIRKRPKAEIRARVMELLELVHLENFADRYPAQLSGGQRQRMALARALAVQPKLLLLDEPFGALDVKVRQELRAWLRELHEQVHATTVFVTHDQEEAMELADQVVLINDGMVEQIGPPEELYDHPANPFVMGFLGDTTRMGEHLVRPHDIEVLRSKNGHEAHEAVIQRVIGLGFHSRIEVVLADGTESTVQLTRAHARQLELKVGDTVFLRRLGEGPVHEVPDEKVATTSDGETG